MRHSKSIGSALAVALFFILATPTARAQEQAPPETRSFGPLKYTAPSGAAAKLIPDISAIGNFSGAYFTNDPGPNGDNPYRTGFNLQEIEIGIQSVIDPYMKADIFLSLHQTGIDVEEAYATTLSLPKGLQIRAGKYKLAFGRQNQKHPEIWPFVDDNLINHIILGDEGFNDMGFEVSYLFSTPFFLQWQSSMTQGDNAGNFDGVRKGDFAYTGRLTSSVDLSDNVTALIGASAAFGWNNTARGELTSIAGGDFLLKWRPAAQVGIDWQTEYIFRSRQTPAGYQSDGGICSYVLGKWTKRWGAGLRGEYYGMPQIGQRIASVSPMITFGTTEFFQLRLQYELQKTIHGGIANAAFLQMIFSVGPHGAHQF